MIASLISTLLFLAIAAAFVIPTIFRAKKTRPEYYAARLILTLLSGFVSAGLAWAVGALTSPALSSLIRGLIDSDDLASLPLIDDLIAYPIACVISCLSFITIYLIVRPLVCIAARPLSELFCKITSKKGENAEQNERPKKNVIGMVLGGLCGLLVFCTLAAPGVCGLSTLHGVVPIYDLLSEELPISSEAVDILDGTTANPATFVVRIFGGEPVFRILTTHKVGDSYVSLRRESDMMGAAVKTMTLSFENADSDEISDSILKFEKKFAKTSLVPEVTVALAEKALDENVIDDLFDKNGGEYFSSKSKTAKEICDNLKDLDTDRVRSISSKLCLTASVLIDHGYLFGDRKFSDIVYDSDAASDILVGFLDGGVEQERLISLVNATITDATKAIGSPEDAKDLKIKSKTLKKPKKEAKAIAETICGIMSMMKNSNFNDIASLMERVGVILDTIDDSELFGGKIEKTLTMLLGLPQISDKLMLDHARAAEISASIVKDAKKDSYRSVMGNIGVTFNSMIVLIDTDRDDPAAVTDHAADMIRSANSTSVEVVKNVATPEFIEYYVGIDKGADEISTLVVDLLDDFSEKQESMSDDKVKSEAAALADLLELTTGINQNGASSGMGGTGVTAKKYVDSVTASDIVLEIMIERTHDNNGNVVLDPLGLEPKLSDGEKSSLICVLGDKYSNKNDDTSRKEVEALGALLGVHATIINGNVVYY